jgi:hypothetical protein
MSFFAQGRVMAAVTAVLILMATFAVSIFSCAENKTHESLMNGMVGIPAAILGGLTGIPQPSLCVGWIPAYIGVILEGALSALMVACLMAVVLG